jgi:hypothetical protein
VRIADVKSEGFQTDPLPTNSTAERSHVMQNREGNSATAVTSPSGARNHKVNCQCGLCLRIRAQAVTAAQKEATGRTVRRRVTPRNKRFVQEYVSPESPGHRNATAAARLAGYSPDSADDIGAVIDHLNPSLLNAPRESKKNIRHRCATGAALRSIIHQV